MKMKYAQLWVIAVLVILAGIIIWMSQRKSPSQTVEENGLQSVYHLSTEDG